ncbi:FAD-dependent oxidoreductase [Spirochaeta isovalerica]|uniref:NADPH-dependent 2,4-dienoyl-CoA reductase/sulfur reductase-like enzyme n=1 Tax=Spirochaeta isovalerica TaxID=150 RepID=A0A841R8V8_9SPIO|nr:FAD-dependent oxidoreductase [Spirochaeta isovalerica]MBB6479389.1 NADPH-dependent 2,4-dienoyl-CoA reductase/sulfur reductase-like enzyme [Spirochaeta isovalerica]
MIKHEIIVIGGGPAGITLAKMLGKRVAVVRPEKASMIYCALPYAIEGIISHGDTLKSDNLVTGSGASLIRDTVAEVDWDNKILRMESGEEYGYEKLIIATGAVPFIPPIPGRDLKGVMGFKTEKDLAVVNHIVSTGLDRAVVVGAGAIGIELAQALNHRGVEVELVDLEDSVLPNLIDRDMQDLLYKELDGQGVKIHLGVKVTEVKGTEEAEGVILDNGDVLPATLVVFAVGAVAEVSLFKDTALKMDRGGIIVNDKMETNLDNVYAVGDCTQFTSGITGEVTPGKLATNAVPMAKVLGFNLKGQDRRYPGFFNGAATKVGTFFVGGTGLSEKAALKAGFDVVSGYSAVTTKFPIIPGAENKQMKLVADRKTHRVLGAQIISKEPVVGRIDLLTYAIQKESTVEDLSALSYASQPHQSFYPAANIVVLAAEDIRKKLA